MELAEMSEQTTDTWPKGSGGVSSQALLERAAAFYMGCLAEAEGAFEFLKKSGLGSPYLLESMGIGFCSGQLTEVLPARKGAAALYRALAKAGVLRRDGTEELIAQLTVPLRDSDGGVVGLVGIDPATGHEAVAGKDVPCVWNVPALVAHAEALATPRLLDGLALVAAGLPNVIAMVGTPSLREEQLLSGLGVYGLSFIAATEKAVAYAKALGGIRCHALELPDEVTPISVLGEQGAEALAAMVDEAQRHPVGVTCQDGVENLPDGFRTKFGKRGYEIRGIERTGRRLRAAVRVERQGRLHVDSVDLYSSRARRNLSLDLGRFFEEAKDAIDGDIDRLIRLCEQWCEQRPDPDGAAKIQLSEKEVREARELGKADDLMARILSDYELCGLIGEEPNKLLCYLAAVSRMMEEPLSVLILSSSGAGKSVLQDASLAFCPPEDVVKLTSMTGKALFYKGRTSLKHRVLALEEEAGAEGAAYPLRALISSGELVIETTVKDLGTGKLTSVQNRVEGPTAVFITTTSPNTDPETRSRFFVTTVDESREQTRRILDLQRQSRTLSGRTGMSERKEVLRRHRNFQRLLQPVAVVNPFAAQIQFGDDRLQSRRDQPKLLNLIAAVAFLRQMVKPVHTLASHGRTQPYVEVDEEDMRIANGLAVALLRRSMDDLNPVSAELLAQMQQLVDQRVGQHEGDGVPPRPEEISFTRRELREFSGWPHTRVRRYLVELVEMEFVHAAPLGMGRGYSYSLCRGLPVIGEGGPAGQRWSAVATPVATPQVSDEEQVTGEVAGNHEKRTSE
jgi:DNA primase